MMYFLAIVLPPVAVLFSGKPIQAILNLILTMLGWVPGVVHACLVVHDSKEEDRTRRVIKEMRRAEKA